MSDNAAQSKAVKAVIPAAGLATRFLPATKAVPKELLPVVDRPVSAVHRRGGRPGRNHRRSSGHRPGQDQRWWTISTASPDLESRLEAKGDMERLAAVRRPSELAEIYTCRQPEQLGLGHAVAYAESHVGDEPFVVLLGDEFVDDGRAAAAGDAGAAGPHRRRRARLHRGGPQPRPSRYGIASVDPPGAELAATWPTSRG